MTDVIEAMARDFCDWLGEDANGWSETARDEYKPRWTDFAPICKRLTKTAEQAGWRLVPVEPTDRMRNMLTRVPDAVAGGAFPRVSKYRLTPTWRDVLKAAPRPWDDEGESE